VRITSDLQAARADLAEMDGYLLVLEPKDRALLDRQGAAIERRWHGKEVFAICNRAQALALRPAAYLDEMDATKRRDESLRARTKEEEPAETH
jgi:hypothetical protein